MHVQIATIALTILALVLAIKRNFWLGWTVVLLIGAWHIDVGFALTPFLIFGILISVWIFIEKGCLSVIKILRRDSLWLLFPATMLFAAAANGFPIRSIRQIILITITIIFARIAAAQMGEPHGIKRAISAFRIGAVIIGIVSICFYALYIFFPIETISHPLSTHAVAIDPVSLNSRITGLEADPNAFAAKALFFLAIISIGLLRQGSNQLLKAFTAVILSSCIILSGSRGGLFSMSVIISLFLFFGLIRGRNTNLHWSKQCLSVAFVTFFLMPLVYVSFQYWTEMVQWLSNFLTKRQPFYLSRFLLWQNTVKIFLENPIFGVGQGMLAQHSYSLFGMEKQAHNTFLELIAENGIFTFIIFLLYVFQVMNNTYKAYTNENFKLYRKDIAAFFLGWISILLMFNSLSIISFPLFWITTEILLYLPRLNSIRYREKKVFNAFPSC